MEEIKDKEIEQLIKEANSKAIWQFIFYMLFLLFVLFASYYFWDYILQIIGLTIVK